MPINKQNRNDDNLLRRAGEKHVTTLNTRCGFAVASQEGELAE